MELYLDPSWKKIGISVSGGADSTLLAYLICSNTDAEIHFTNQIRLWRTRPWQEYVADQIFNWFKARFRNKFYIHRNLIPPELEWADKGPSIIDEYGKLKSGNQIILRSHNEYISHKYNLDALYGGVNQNPPIKLEGSLPNRDRENISIKSYFLHDGVHICHPFVYTTKDWIIKQYHDHNILDLYNLTRSCEGEFNEINYKTYIPGQFVPTCNKCFWCQERNWAESKYFEKT